MRPLLLLVACLGLVCGCSDSDREKDARTPGAVFAVGFDENFAPFSFPDPSEDAHIGFDLDLAREVARRNSWKYVPVPLDWRMKEVLLNSGQIDCIWSSFHINNRENLFEWSRPYTDGAQVVVVRGDSPIRSLEQLDGKVVAVQAGSVNYDVWDSGAVKLPPVAFRKFVPVDNFSLLLQNLTGTAEYDAAITDAAAAAWWGKQNQVELRVVGEPILETPCGVAFRRGNRALRDRVQLTLEEMAADGALARISGKWFGRDITSPELTPEAK